MTSLSYKFLRKIKKNVKKAAKKAGILPEPPTKVVKEEVPEEISAEKQELDQVMELYKGQERDKIWAFVSGQYSQDFRGNPKYLFVYINKYRPDIKAYWVCMDEDTIAQVRALGFQAYQMESPAAQYVISKTGVLVGEQVKAVIPQGLENAKYLNLWHGVGGVKAVERSLLTGDLAVEIARKYIEQNEYYRTYQLYVAPSAFIEAIAKEQLGLTERQIIHAGYARNLYQANYERIQTFDHDLLKQKGLPSDTRIAAYTPTYRNESREELFASAIPDVEALIRVCEENHILMIFKMHPLLEDEVSFRQAREAYQDCPWLYFWDNKNDFYEIMNQVDLCIMDYSSIFTDFIAVGVKHFLRYAFDFTGEDLDFPMAYDEVTPGRKCESFEELLAALGDYEKDDIEDDLVRIGHLYWEYADKDSLDRIIEETLAFKPEPLQLPTLYSFDIFDTLFSRKVLAPEGIFYLVREKMMEYGGFPLALVLNYPSVRKSSEANVREYYHKSKDLRDSETVEITFEEIFARMAYVYHLNEEQVELLKNWELEAELQNVIPLPEQIQILKELHERGEQVVLISDMYLSREFIQKMLAKADPVLAELPMFLSRDYGVQKVSRLLYLEVYKSFSPSYNFRKWIHYGDNPNADHLPARRMNIQVRKVIPPVFGEFQEELVKELNTYDGYLTAALQARMIKESVCQRDEFVISFIALCMVPYVDWALRDAMERGYETLYFISRDGHPLKRIADAIIEEKGWKIKTKYLYASRRAWRIPSFIHGVDVGFWQHYGNFGNIVSKEKLLRAMDLDEEMFSSLFPAIQLDEVDFLNQQEVKKLVEIFQNSSGYEQYLLEKSKEERPLPQGYLRQEIDASEKFAIVEYWGRGYTQESMVALWQDIVGEEVDVPFYYSRSILPTQGHAVRYNFTTNSSRQFFIEGFFANMPYKSVEKYEVQDGKIVPVIVPASYDEDLFASMQKLLPEFARRYAALELRNPVDTDRMLYEFVLNYYGNHLSDPFLAENIGSLVDSITLYGNKREFAPPFSMELLDQFQEKTVSKTSSVVTTSISMSVIRSTKEVQQRFFDMYQVLPGEKNLAGGRLLTEEEQEESVSYRKKYEELIPRAEEFRRMYETAVAENEVQDRILLINGGKSIAHNCLGILEKELSKQDKYSVETLLLGQKQISDAELAGKVSSARYILVISAIKVFCRTTFREETELIMLRESPFSLYNKALTSVSAIKWRRKFELLANKNDVDVLQIPSKAAERLFRERYSRNATVNCCLHGNCNTDFYFDRERIADRKCQFLEKYPEADGKKILFYMPKWRARKAFSGWTLMLDLEELQEQIGGEYFVVVDFDDKKMQKTCENVVSIPGFSVELDGTFGVREMLAIADVVVGDYRDSFFETALLHKPAFSTAYDFEEHIRKASMEAYSTIFEQTIFCPIIRTSMELAEHLSHLEDYDFSPMEAFREQMLSGCDGNSVQRVMEYLMKE